MLRRVSVIGAGAAGLVAARELLREGHTVVVYEKGDQVGGTWIYTPETESDPLGLDPDRVKVHSSLYMSLRMNLSREIMGFKDYPFVTQNDRSGDPRRYPGHEAARLYLQNFARDFGVNEVLRLETEVVNVCLVDNNKWKVKSRNKDGVFEDEFFDAVVVCNGHYSEPNVAEIHGVRSWPGKQMHSHNYRVPKPFKDQVVILIGNNTSAYDIKRELAEVAKEVHVAARSVADETFENQRGYDNLWLHSMVERVNEDGTVVFRNGKAVLADVIIHCTGYKYDIPFLETNGIVRVDDKRVGPLYKHVFPPVLAPWLSFIGIPWMAIPFLLFEYQSKWIAGALSGRIELPSQDEMMEDVKALYSTLEASGKPESFTHKLESMFEHMDWLAEQCGCLGLEEWRKPMGDAAFANFVARPTTYRDEWDDDHLVAQAHKDFIKYIK